MKLITWLRPSWWYSN